MSWSNKGWQGGDGPWGKPKQPNGNNKPPASRPPGKGPEFDDYLRKGKGFFDELFGGPGGSGKSAVILIFGVFILWLASGIYFVEPNEQGVVLRFGQYHRTTLPGPNYHMPYPVETVYTPSVTSINRIVIGDDNGGLHKGGDGTSNDESLMLTGDENIVNMSYEVQWKIKNAENYLFNVRNPEQTVKAVAESAMREVVGQTPLANTLSQSRVDVELRSRQLMQRVLDAYKSGVEVVGVNIKELNPPKDVIEAFYDVQRAKANQEQLRNEAEAYRNDILPRTRGEAEQILQQAEGYKERIVAQAKGDAARFSSIYTEYVRAKDVTKKRMYLETMEQVLKGMDKTVVDSSANGVVPVLPLPAAPPGSFAAPATPAPPVPEAKDKQP